MDIRTARFEYLISHNINISVNLIRLVQIFAEDFITVQTFIRIFNFRLIEDLWRARQPTTVYLEMSSSLGDSQHSPLWFATCYKAWLVLNRPDRIHNVHLTNFFTLIIVLTKL